MKKDGYRSKAGEYLKGRYGEAFVVTSICLFVFVTFRAVVIFADIPLVVEAVTAIICFFIMTPFLTGGVWWFFQTVSGGDNRNLLKLYSGYRLNRRAAVLYIVMWCRGFLSLFPSAVCFTAAYVLFFGDTGLNGEIIVFGAFQLVMLGIVLFGLYIRVTVSMVLSPFIFIMHPDRNPFGVVRESAKLMKGNRLKFIRLIMGYIPAMLPVVTIPFVVPSAAMSAAVFAKETIEEKNLPPA